MKRTIDSKRYAHKAPAAATTNHTTKATKLCSLCFPFLYSQKCSFSLHYFIYRASSRVFVWCSVCVCARFASYLMVMVGVRAALYCVHSGQYTHINVCYALDFVCICLRILIFVRSHSFSQYVPFSVMHAYIYIFKRVTISIHMRIDCGFVGWLGFNMRLM